MKIKTFALYSIIGILVLTTILVFAQAKISGNATLGQTEKKILPGVPTPEKYYPKPKPIYPPDYPIVKPECITGKRRCVGTNLQGCIGEHWIVMATCARIGRCTTDGCKPIAPTCQTGARRCVGNNLQGCINGEWEVTATCRANQYCTTGGCRQAEPTCQTGSARCRGNNLQACISGQWIATAVCGQNQYCTTSGCITVPSPPPNIIVLPQGLSCPGKPADLDIKIPQVIWKQSDCHLTPIEVDQYLVSLEKMVAACTQAQSQQINLASADKQYIAYQISLLYSGYPLPPFAAPGTCSLTPQAAETESVSSYTPAKGQTYYTDWLKYITDTAQKYCTKAQRIINPVVDGCNNINANLAACGTDYGAQMLYLSYLDGQMLLSNSKMSEAAALSAAFTFHSNQLRDTLAKEGITC